jgi:hypothetical protein
MFKRECQKLKEIFFKQFWRYRKVDIKTVYQYMYIVISPVYKCYFIAMVTKKKHHDNSISHTININQVHIGKNEQTLLWKNI